MKATTALALISALLASACSFTLDPEAGFPCDGPGQCAAGYRCIERVCAKSAGACGDFVVDAGEECDDGRSGNVACPYGETGCTLCATDCRQLAGTTSYCGDGATDGASGEACDDGNAVTEPCAYGLTSCEVCDASCQVVAGATSYCGDGATDSTHGEQCDDGNAITEACAYGAVSCAVCDAGCQTVAGATSYCGDGSTDGGNGESCDAGEANSNAPDAACRVDCSPKRCGDGIADGDEGCDLGGANVAACPEYVFTLPSGFCTPACEVLDCSSTGYCGDGDVDSAAGEVCDLGADNGVCGQPCRRCEAWTCDAEWAYWAPQPPDSPPDADYDTTIPGVVKDKVTGLSWERSPPAATYTYAQAQAYCGALTLGGLTGWRIPSHIELATTVDYGKRNPAIIGVLAGTQVDWQMNNAYLTSTLWSESTGNFVGVEYWWGQSKVRSKTDSSYLRCVR